MHVFVPQRSLWLAPPPETISQVIVITPWQSCSVEGGGGLQRLYGERDCRSWPSFPCLIRNLCTSALPPPKPKPLLLQACEGGSVWSEVSSLLQQQALCAMCARCPYRVCVFFTGFIIVCDWKPADVVLARLTSLLWAGHDGDEGWRCLTYVKAEADTWCKNPSDETVDAKQCTMRVEWKEQHTPN